jgi:hypothetical protein
MKWQTTLLLLSATSLPLRAQVSTTAAPKDPTVPAIYGSGIAAPGAVRLPAVKGQPYSLVSKTTTIRTALDGTPINTVLEERKMRDAEGRERTEIIQSKGDSPTPHITDPVAHVTFTLFPSSKTALVTHIPVPPPPTPEQEAKAAELRARTEAFQKAHPPDPANQLDSRTIAGVYATGTRRVVVIPPGRVHNDQEIRIVEDTWTSPDLKIKMASTKDDPRPAMGKVSMIVTDLQRTDPDPALFQIPADYKIVEH